MRKTRHPKRSDVHHLKGIDAMRVQEIMSRHVISINVDAPVIDAIKTMLSYRIGALPVVNSNGKLVGMLSKGDFLRRAEIGTERKRGRWLALLTGTDRIARDFSRQHGREVGEIMAPNPFTVSENTPLEQLVCLMESRGLKRFPVVRGDDLVGMVTRTDFLTAIATVSRDKHGSTRSDDEIRRSLLTFLSQAPWRPRPLDIEVQDGTVTLRGAVSSASARKATIIASENVAGVKQVENQLTEIAWPPAEEDLGGGDFVSLQEEPSTVDDEAL